MGSLSEKFLHICKFKLPMKDYKWFHYDLHLEREYFKLYLYGFHIFNMIYYLWGGTTCLYRIFQRAVVIQLA